jgi:hypothetical protein
VELVLLSDFSPYLVVAPRLPLWLWSFLVLLNDVLTAVELE